MCVPCASYQCLAKWLWWLMCVLCVVCVYKNAFLYACARAVACACARGEALLFLCK